MFAPIATITSIVSLAVLAVATPTGNPNHGEPASSCSTGPVQCCNSVQKANSTSATALMGLLGIVLQNLNVDVGIGCSPISVIPIGGGTCKSNVVCCQDNSHGGLISIGCLPVSL